MSDDKPFEKENLLIEYLNNIGTELYQNTNELERVLQELNIAKPYVDNICNNLTVFLSETNKRLQGDGTLEHKLKDVIAALSTIGQFVNNYSLNHVRQAYNIEGMLTERNNVKSILDKSVSSIESKKNEVKKFQDSNDNLDENRPEKLSTVRHEANTKEQS